MTALKDTDEMPFGKHQGTPMQDVPANYLCWLWNTGLRDDLNTPVGGYIKESLEALKHEHPEGDWD